MALNYVTYVFCFLLKKKTYLHTCPKIHDSYVPRGKGYCTLSQRVTFRRKGNIFNKNSLDTNIKLVIKIPLNIDFFNETAIISELFYMILLKINLANKTFSLASCNFCLNWFFINENLFPVK